MLRTATTNILVFIGYHLVWLLSYYLGGEYVGRPMWGYVALDWGTYVEIDFPILTVIYGFFAEISIYGVRTVNHRRGDSEASQVWLPERAASLLPTVTLAIAAVLAWLAVGMVVRAHCSLSPNDIHCANFVWPGGLTWLLPVWIAVYGVVVSFMRWAIRSDSRTAPVRRAKLREQQRQGYVAALERAEIDANNGNVSAQVQLGYMYEAGEAVWAGSPWSGDDGSRRPNDIKAMNWYRKAADQGNAQAMYHVGHLWARGWARGQDIKQARAWMERAAALGDKDASQWLAEHREPDPSRSAAGPD
jgi:hypothetical protein